MARCGRFFINRKAFTLIEVLISTVVLFLVFATAFLSLGSLSDQEIFTRDRLTAKNLLSAFFEDTRQRSLSEAGFFGSIDATTYPADGPWTSLDAPGYPSGFFQRRMVFISGTSEIKTFSMTVQWTEKGSPQNLTYLFSLARPPYALPGNISGTITACQGGAPIENAAVSIYQGGGMENTMVRTDAQGSYDFNTLANSFILPPAANYRLQVVHNGPYGIVRTPEDQLITVQSEQTTPVDLCLPPAGAGTIMGKVTLPSGDAISGQHVSLYQAGEFLSSVMTNGSGDFSFDADIHEPGEDECFTLITSNQFVETSFPYQSNRCGHLCAAMPGAPWQGINYSYRGWSSSVALDQTYHPTNGYTNTACTNPWEGSEDADRVCLTNGETVVINIVLDPVPEATVQGYLKEVNASGNPVPNADVRSRWWWQTAAQQYQATTSDNSGFYSVQIPAVHALFPPNTYYGAITASKAFAGEPQCCNVTTTQTKFVGGNILSGLLVNAVLSRNYFFDINTTPPACGDCFGNVTDDATNGDISGAKISLAGAEKFTNASGDYQFQCPDPPSQGKSLEAGTYNNFQVQKSGYYARTRIGWPYQAIDAIQITANQNVQEDFTLYPRGSGTILGTVTNIETDDPIENATVMIFLYGSGNPTVRTTNASGQYSAANIVESWPPVGVTLDPNLYQTNARTHSMVVTCDGYEDAQLTDITLEKQDNKVIDFELTPAGSGGGM